MKRANSGLRSDRKMSRTLTIQLKKPIASVKIADNHRDDTGTGLSGHSGTDSSADTQQTKSMQDLEHGKAAIAQVCRTLNGLVDKLNQFLFAVRAIHNGVF